MSRVLSLPAIAALMTLALWLNGLVSVGAGEGEPTQAPEFTHAAPADWINSAPLRLEDLRGNVVLLDFWTFECWNCYRSFPWLNVLESKYSGKGLKVIGVHSPEFSRERDRARVAAKVAEFDLHHPIMIDNDFSYWQALGNRYWPAFYLIDRQGYLRHSFVGETHIGDTRAQAVEQAVQRLLAETSGSHLR
jgi:thiol-disulfide isomerase/thioredoxin